MADEDAALDPGSPASKGSIKVAVESNMGDMSAKDAAAGYTYLAVAGGGFVFAYVTLLSIESSMVAPSEGVEGSPGFAQVQGGRRLFLLSALACALQALLLFLIASCAFLDVTGEDESEEVNELAAYDADGDGILTNEEMIAGLKSTYPSLSDDEILEIANSGGGKDIVLAGASAEE